MGHFNLNIHIFLYLRELLVLLIFCFSLSFSNVYYCSLSVYFICVFADLVVHLHFKLATRFICICSYCQGLSSLTHSSSPQNPVVTSTFQDRWEPPTPAPAHLPSAAQLRAKLQWRQGKLVIVLLS